MRKSEGHSTRIPQTVWDTGDMDRPESLKETIPLNAMWDLKRMLVEKVVNSPQNLEFSW